MKDNNSCHDRDAQKAIWVQEQREIAEKVVVLADDDENTSANRFARIPLEPPQHHDKHRPCYYGGVDVSFPQDGDEHDSVAVYVVVDAATMKVVYQDSEYFALKVPYIPSFLAFREIDPLQRLVEKQIRDRPDLKPDAILVDGNGLLHSRLAGIACFLGVRTGIPTIGIGKTLFCEGKLTKENVLRGIEDSLAIAVDQLSPEEEDGNHCVWMDALPISGAANNNNPQPANERPDRGALVQTMAPFCRGFAVPLFVENAAAKSRNASKTVACALVGHGGRVQGRKSSSLNVGSKNPIFVSVGHKISLKQAVSIAASLCVARIPEPVRQADLVGREMLRKVSQQRQQQGTILGGNDPNAENLETPKAPEKEAAAALGKNASNASLLTRTFKDVLLGEGSDFAF